MSEPIVFISRNRVKPGMQDEFRRHYAGSIQPTMENKPGTHVQLAYLSEDRTQAVIVRVFPDAAALDRQLQGADERSKAAYQFIEPVSVELYGAPNEYALEMMKKVAGSGIQVSIQPEYIGGFLRSQPG